MSAFLYSSVKSLLFIDVVLDGAIYKWRHFLLEGRDKKSRYFDDSQRSANFEMSFFEDTKKKFRN